MKISGKIFVDDERGDLSEAEIYIRLENVGLKNVKSVKVAELRLDVPRGRGERMKELPFELEAEIPSSPDSYSLRVHADMDGDGQVSSGDYVTIESYPVDTTRKLGTFNIRLRKIP